MVQTQPNRHILAIINMLIIFQSGYAEGNDDLDMFAVESALKFSEKWLTNSTIHITMLLPTHAQFKFKDVVNIKKKMTEVFKRNVYFMFSTNISKYNNLQHPQTELLWFPLETKHYDLDCRVFNTSKKYRTGQKHFLVFAETKQDVEFVFQYCSIISRTRSPPKPPSTLTVLTFLPIYSYGGKEGMGPT